MFLGGIDDNVYMKSASSRPERHGVFVLGNWWKFIIGFVLTSYVYAYIDAVRGASAYYSTIWFNPIVITITMFRSFILWIKILSPFSSASLPEAGFVNTLYLIFLFLVFVIIFALITTFVFFFINFLGIVIKKVRA